MSISEHVWFGPFMYMTFEDQKYFFTGEGYMHDSHEFGLGDGDQISALSLK